MSKALIAALISLSLATALHAQSTGLSLTGDAHNRSLPVDIQSDQLTVNQDTQTALFSGNAKVVQGGLTLSADEISVSYSQDGAEIETVNATGSVLFSNSAETATANQATYSVQSGDLKMSGSVVLVQGPSQISGNSLSMNILTNIAEMSGNVRTKLVPRN
ncbi:MAG: LptA/OstA family protein [Pseudomonadota bacterium]